MVGRDEAKRAAERYLRESGHPVTEVRSVVDVFEIRGPLRPYGVRLDDRCWIAYLESPEWWVIRSADIVVVSKDDGRILFFGSANDEG